MLIQAQKASEREFLMLRMLWRTGVRVNELLNIRPGDIESRNGVVNITKVKGGKQGRVHFDAETIKMLSEYGSAQQLPDDRPVFALKQRQVRNIVKAPWFSHRKGCPPTYLPTFISDPLCAKRLELRRLQQVRGHSSLNVTMVYLQFNDRDIKEFYHKTPF